jgi:hypothetical protein
MPDRKQWPLLPGLAMPQQLHWKQSEQISLANLATFQRLLWSNGRFAYLAMPQRPLLSQDTQISPSTESTIILQYLG